MVKIYALAVFLNAVLTLNFQCLFGQTPAAHSPAIVIKFDPDVTEKDKAEIKHHFQTEMTFTAVNNKLELWCTSQDTSTGTGRNLKLMMDKLAELPGVLAVEPNYTYRIDEVPDDPYFSEQWSAQNIGQSGGLSGADIDLVNAWNIHTGEKEIITGILDTGIDFAHEDLVENIWQNLKEDADGDGHTIELVNGHWELDPGDLDQIDQDGNGYTDDLIGWDFVNGDNNPFDDNGHGTHIAGIIGAKGNNTKGIAGVNWSAKLMPLKTFDVSGSGSLATILPALIYARNMGVHIINNSWGGDSFSKLMYEEISLMDQEGQLLIAAAGNDGNNNYKNPVYPASYELDNIISVASTDRNDQLSDFSNYGAESVDLAAPGQDIFSTLPGGGYGAKSGTSMAAPLVSGAAALLWSYAEDLSHYQIKTIILSSVDVLPQLEGKCETSGRLNVLKSLRISTDLCTDWAMKSMGLTVYALADDSDFIWALLSNGVVKLNKKDCSSQTYNYNNSPLPNSIFQCIAVDQDGQIWLGTRNNGIYVYDGTNWIHYDTNNGLHSNRILSIFVDQQNKIWIGTDNLGLMIFDGSAWEYYEEADGLPNNNVKDIAVDEQGIAWVCTNKGLGIFDGFSWQTFKTANSGIPTNDLNSIAISTDGSKWIGSGSGVIKYDGKNWEIFDTWNSGLPRNSVNDIAIDEAGVVWIATNGGLARFNESGWTVYKTTNSQLQSNSVLAVLVDSFDNTWVGMNSGINVFAPDVVASFSNDPVVCLNVPQSFRNSSLRAEEYAWTLNGVPVSTDKDLEYTFTTPGMYVISLTASNDISTDVYTKSLEVKTLVELDLGSDRFVCADAIVLDVCRDDLNYSWYDQNNVMVGDKRYLTVRTDGIYTVRVEDRCNNVASDSVQVGLSSGCVWPGDVNVDGKADVLDFLGLGLAQGVTGMARSRISTAWEAQISVDWPTSFPANTGLEIGGNHKHADCNGDGWVDIATDGLAVKQNANALLIPEINDSPAGAVFSLEYLSTQMINSDYVYLEYDLHLTGTNNPLSDVYGLALTFDFNLPVLQAPSLNTSGSWMGDVESLVIHQWGSLSNCPQEMHQRLDLAITRKDGEGSNGEGSIGILGIIIAIEDVAEDLDLMGYVNFQIAPAAPMIIDPDAELIPVNQSLSEITSIVKIELPGHWAQQTERENFQYRPSPLFPLLEDFLLFPNPAQDDVNLTFFLEEDDVAVQVQVRDLQGFLRKELAQTLNGGPNQLKLHTADLRPGLYFVNIRTATQQVTKRMSVGSM